MGQGHHENTMLLLAGAWALANYTAIAWPNFSKANIQTEYNPLIVCSLIMAFFMTFFLIATK